MTEREALKLALEALKKSHICPLLPDDCAEAITAIKEALAQPEQEPVAWMDDYNACKCPDNEARCFSDKVFRMMQKHTDSLVKRQEPVAKVCHDLDGHIGWNPNLKQLPNEGTPLYTTPPQRNPLTRKEVLAIIDKHPAEKKTGLPMFYRDQVLDIARAIEAAHGIKGEA